MSNPRPPPTKKSRTSSETDSCSTEDPPYASSEESITQKKEISLTESFSQFAMLAGETRVCTVKPWNELKPVTQERKARVARNLFLTMLGIMVPDDTEEFKKLVEKAQEDIEELTEYGIYIILSLLPHSQTILSRNLGLALRH